MTERERRREDPRLRHLEEVVSRHDERLREVGSQVQDVKASIQRIEGALQANLVTEDRDRATLLVTLKEMRVAAEVLSAKVDHLNTDFEKRGSFFKGIAWLGGVMTTAVAVGVSIAGKLKGD